MEVEVPAVVHRNDGRSEDITAIVECVGGGAGHVHFRPKLNLGPGESVHMDVDLLAAAMKMAPGAN